MCVLTAGLGALGVWQRASVLTWIGGQLVHSDPLQRADAILVLAGGAPERELEAADLYHAGFAPRILLTRDSEHPGVALLKARGISTPSDLEERLRYFRELGVPAASIVVLDGLAESTAHEAVLVRDWVRSQPLTSLIVVTSAFHTGRARLAFLREFGGSGVTLMFRPASADEFRPDTWWKSRVTLRNGLIEWQKQVLYRLHW